MIAVLGMGWVALLYGRGHHPGRGGHYVGGVGRLRPAPVDPADRLRRLAGTLLRRCNLALALSTMILIALAVWSPASSVRLAIG